MSQNYTVIVGSDEKSNASQKTVPLALPKKLSSKEKDALASKLPMSHSSRLADNMIILDEDEYVSTLEKIIARDFFPLVHAQDNEKRIALNTQNTHVSNSNPSIDRAYVEYLRPELIDESTPPLMPVQSQTRSEADNNNTHTNTDTHTHCDLPPHPSPGESRGLSSLSLSSFQSQVTSEDNMSAAKLLLEQQEQQRRRNWWMQEGVERERDRLVTQRSPALVLTAEAVNSLMFHPSHIQHSNTSTRGGPHTPLLTVVSAHSRERIVYANTRFDDNTAAEDPNTRDKSAHADIHTHRHVGSVGNTLSSANINVPPPFTWGRIVGPPRLLDTVKDEEDRTRVWVHSQSQPQPQPRPQQGLVKDEPVDANIQTESNITRPMRSSQLIKTEPVVNIGRVPTQRPSQPSTQQRGSGVWGVASADKDPRAILNKLKK